MGVIEDSAKEIMSHYKQTLDISQLIDDVADYSSWYGRFSKHNRDLFTNALKRELINEGAEWEDKEVAQCCTL